MYWGCKSNPECCSVERQPGNIKPESKKATDFLFLSCLASFVNSHIQFREPFGPEGIAIAGYQIRALATVTGQGGNGIQDLGLEEQAFVGLQHCDFAANVMRRGPRTWDLCSPFLSLP